MKLYKCTECSCQFEIDGSPCIIMPVVDFEAMINQKPIVAECSPFTGPWVYLCPDCTETQGLNDL